MLEPYRRHSQDCPHRAKGNGWTRCQCRIWVYGHLNGQPLRTSLGTRDWGRALDRIRLLEAGQTADLRGHPTLEEATDAYLADCQRRNLKASTLRSYRKMLEHLSQGYGSILISELTQDRLRQFRAGRDVAPSTSRKELECLRAFCSWCVGRGWLTANPAKAIKAPKESGLPTLPFEAREVAALLKACGKIDANHPARNQRIQIRARAFVLLLLYSGLRISDAAKVGRDQVDFRSRYLTLRMMKTTVPLRVKLSPECMTALRALPVESAEYFFWSGRSKLATVVGNLRRTIERLGKIAGVDAHPHRFRDTFACRLLESGADIRTVSLLLGHTSIRTTEKHYAHFVRSHQALLDRATARLKYKAS